MIEAIYRAKFGKRDKRTKPKFNRNKYQREYMRRRRAKLKSG